MTQRTTSKRSGKLENGAVRLKHKFYEKLDDFKTRVLLLKEPGAKCSCSGGLVMLKGYGAETLTAANRTRIVHEVQCMQQVECPFITKCFDAFQDQGWWWLVLENSAGGDLYRIAKRCPESVRNEGWLVSQVILPLLQTLAYIHAENLIHRDIKPENILFNSEKVAKVGGFFLAHNVKEQGLPYEMVGTLDYVAPEVFLANAADSHIQHYDHKVDIWAVGVMIYDLLIGYPPFHADDPNQTVDNVISMDPILPPIISEEAMDFIALALTKNPLERPDAAELLDHPWVLEKHEWEPEEDFIDPVPRMITLQPDPADSLYDATDLVDVFSGGWVGRMSRRLLQPITRTFRKQNSMRGTPPASSSEIRRSATNPSLTLQHTASLTHERPYPGLGRISATFGRVADFFAGTGKDGSRPGSMLSKVVQEGEEEVEGKQRQAGTAAEGAEGGDGGQQQEGSDEEEGEGEEEQADARIRLEEAHTHVLPPNAVPSSSDEPQTSPLSSTENSGEVKLPSRLAPRSYASSDIAPISPRVSDPNDGDSQLLVYGQDLLCQPQGQAAAAAKDHAHPLDRESSSDGDLQDMLPLSTLRQGADLPSPQQRKSPDQIPVNPELLMALSHMSDEPQVTPSHRTMEDMQLVPPAPSPRPTVGPAQPTSSNSSGSVNSGGRHLPRPPDIPRENSRSYRMPDPGIAAAAMFSTPTSQSPLNTARSHMAEILEGSDDPPAALLPMHMMMLEQIQSRPGTAAAPAPGVMLPGGASISSAYLYQSQQQAEQGDGAGASASQPDLLAISPVSPDGSGSGQRSPSPSPQAERNGPMGSPSVGRSMAQGNFDDFEDPAQQMPTASASARRRSPLA